MRSPILLFALLVPATTLGANFSVESAEVKPNSKIAEAQVFKGFGCEGGCERGVGDEAVKPDATDAGSS